MIRRARVIPVLLLKGEGLVKTERFGNPIYVGDPINAAKIFNDAEVDELVLLDITPEAARTGPRFDKLAELATECFMPVCYGGGVRTDEHVAKLFSLGFEKVAFNTATVTEPELIRRSSAIYGASSIIAAIDVRRKMFGRTEVVIDSGKKGTGIDPVTHAKKMVELGAGEILLTSIDQEGSRKGFDVKLTQSVVEAVPVPVVAHGGAGSLEDVRTVICDGHASAAACGSLFVFHGRLKGVLVNYPPQRDLRKLLES